MTTINGGQAVYRVLKANGIDTVFGLLGGSMLELYDAMYQGGEIAYVGARDERAAGHMADAWARMTGKPGVVLGAQAGPGVVNIVTAVAEAQLAYAPLVVIAGAITRADQCKDTFQEIDQVALFAPICKRSVMVTDPARLAPMLEDAIRLANTGRRGPVVLHVPRDLFAAEVPAIDPEAVNIARPGPAAPEDIAAIAQMLADAERPVIFAGGGFKWSAGRAALTALAEKLEVPIVASTGHADVMRHNHPWFAGQAGPRGNRVASRLTKEADVMV
ncbi:MAG: thiamine pyrophosphate-binding protein, partial [Pelagimonas sp.]|nr:thiamine pyrophosphate-binding protein [Pelagimonas sp.]